MPAQGLDRGLGGWGPGAAWAQALALAWGPDLGPRPGPWAWAPAQALALAWVLAWAVLLMAAYELLASLPLTSPLP